MQLKKKLKDFFNVKAHAKLQADRVIFSVRADLLNMKINGCLDRGVSDERYCDHELIVSLTTFGKRLYSVATTIESIMQGTLKPNKIILWLDEKLKGQYLPRNLMKQMERGLTIEYCKDIRSYTKLIPCLKKYPQAIIVTVDDDILYDQDMLEKLFVAHKESPDMIIANRVHQIVLDSSSRPVSYKSWRWKQTLDDESFLNFLTGVGGVLYPPHCLDEEVFNENVFLDICKYADDVWFYAMALKKGTIVKKAYTRDKYGEDYVMNPTVQDVGLCLLNVNDSVCRNDIQIKAVFEKYALYDKLKNN